MTAKEYLISLGLEPHNTVVIAYIDGVMRLPNLIEILEGYAKTKQTEHTYKKK